MDLWSSVMSLLKEADEIPRRPINPPNQRIDVFSFFLLKVFLFSLLVVYAFSCMGIIIIIITCLVNTAVQCMYAIR